MVRILRKVEKMAKNDKKRTVNNASDFFFWKNGFRRFFSDLKICRGAKNLRNLM